MRSKPIGLALIVGTALTLLAGTATASPAVSITSPAAGAVISRSATPQLSVTGEVSFDTPAATERQFFLRHGPCTNATTDTRSLAQEWSGSDVQACGYNGTITPLNEVLVLTGGSLGAPVSEAFPMEDTELPVTLDATKPITGTLDVASFNASGVGAGVGVTTVDFILRGTLNGNLQTIGTTSVSYQQVPGAVHKQVTWSITPAATFDKKDLTTFELVYTVHGVNAQHGFVYFRGLSHLTVPLYTASFTRTVQLAVDTGSFSAANVTVAPDLSSWSATIPTPAAGIHSIKARSVQGSATSPVVQHGITVTA